MLLHSITTLFSAFRKKWVINYFVQQSIKNSGIFIPRGNKKLLVGGGCIQVSVIDTHRISTVPSFEI